MTTPAIQRPGPQWTGVRFPREEYAVGERRIRSMLHGHALRLLYDILHTWLPAADFVGYELAILDDPLDARQHLMPDIHAELERRDTPS